MTKYKALFLGIVLANLTGVLFAQQNLVYNHYFFNPFLYNPSYIAPNGYTELYLNYRKQWAGFEGAPTKATMNLHLPINNKIGIGFTGYQDDAGVLRTTTGLISFGYQVYIGDELNQNKLAFGLSAGLTNSSIPVDKIQNGGVPDIALSNYNTSSLDGQFGFHYQNKNLKISFAIPRIFKAHVASEGGFNEPGLEPLNSTISSISYNFHITPRVSFEPFVLYRTDRTFPAQYEALGVLRIDDLVWAGGSYRQDYGAAAFFGINIKDKIKISYAYELATTQSRQLGFDSHEVQIAFRLGRKRFASSLTNAGSKAPAENVASTEPEIEEKNEEIADAEVKETSGNEEQRVEPHSGRVIKQPMDVKKGVKGKGVEPTTGEAPKTKPDRLVTNSTTSTDDLSPGHYVVVGAFISYQNARKYTTTLRKFGYPAQIAFYPRKKYYIVHMVDQSSTLEDARRLRNEYRKKSRYSFRDTWVLSIE